MKLVKKYIYLLILVILIVNFNGCATNKTEKDLTDAEIDKIAEFEFNALQKVKEQRNLYSGKTNIIFPLKY